MYWIMPQRLCDEEMLEVKKYRGRSRKLAWAIKDVDSTPIAVVDHQCDQFVVNFAKGFGSPTL